VTATAQTALPQVSFGNILYATDFSTPSDLALPYALAIARKYASKIFVAHVVSLSPFPKAAPTLAWRAIAAQAVREAQEAMADVDPHLEEISHEALIRKGDIWTELSAIIEEKRIDLVVLGTHGRTGLNKAVLGSVAERIFRRAHCPVLTVGPNVSAPSSAIADIHEILYPTDFSAASLFAASYAISLAKTTQARLYLLHVVKQTAENVSESRSRDALLDLVPPGTALSCEPKAMVESGVPAQKILSVAEELAADLIVLGVKPPAAFSGASVHLPMATAHHIVSQAKCPTLTVRAP
jgi:nucleotide-binding universal stress UspA family protein